ncbi:MAG: thioredoxin family protein [Pirellulaceae bacterium]
MNGILICATLALSIQGSAPLSYAQARAESLASQRPLLVLVGADWCPACRDLKNLTMTRLRQEGKLNDVVYTVVDYDREPRLASQLMRSSSIPQLLLYTPVQDGWVRLNLQGSQSSTGVLSLIQQGIAMQRREPAVGLAE